MHPSTLGSSHLSSSSSAHPARRTQSSCSKPLVYLAEDDVDLRRLLSDALWEAGFEVLSASSGRDMLTLLTAATAGGLPVPDAFVMDVRMPGFSGIDVLNALRLANWQQPVVMITGFGDPLLHAKAAKYGASVILDKPVDTDDLVDMLDVLLRLSHSESMKPKPDDEAADEPEPETLRSPPSAPGVASEAGASWRIGHS